MTLIRLRLPEPHEFDPTSKSWLLHMAWVEEQMKVRGKREKLTRRLREALRGLRMGWRGELG